MFEQGTYLRTIIISLKEQEVTNLERTIRREIKVAFSKHTQPAAFRVIKWALLVLYICLSWHKPYFVSMLAGLVGVALIMHFFYRYKTRGWTKSFGGWDYDKVFGKEEQPG